MVGKDRRPIVTTVAPTMPVEAARSAPTMTTEMPKPPRSVPNNDPIASSNCSAMRDFSSITPMNTKSGTATRMALSISMMLP